VDNKEGVTPKTIWVEFGSKSLDSVLELKAPPLAPDDAFRQLNYIEQYAANLGCKSMAIETPYIDRDYIEDHGAFYAKSLFPYPNYCRRIHFFSLSEDDVNARIEQTLQGQTENSRDEFKADCRKLSDECDLGFSVIKPLHGSPVGRTVLKCYPKEPKSGKPYVRDFFSTHRTVCHFSGLKFTVRGLAFQQQDRGVSACATTAVWSAMHKTRDHELLPPATPVQITTLATQYSMVSGRAMPSDGLNMDQMCQAIKAIGVSPNLFDVEGQFDLAKFYLYSAIRSGFAPVVLIRRDDTAHAIAVPGIKLKVEKEFYSFKQVQYAHDELIGLFVHDDRHGPYMEADLKEMPSLFSEHGSEPREGSMQIEIPLKENGREKDRDKWTVTHVLIPMHSKIRFSYDALDDIKGHLINDLLRFLKSIEWKIGADIVKGKIRSETLIAKSHRYVERLTLESPIIAKNAIEVSHCVALARYVAVIRISGEHFSPVDIVFDTTGTQNNPHCLGVVVPTSDGPATSSVGLFFAKQLECQLID
jgi:hypothetical protein